MSSFTMLPSALRVNCFGIASESYVIYIIYDIRDD